MASHSAPPPHPELHNPSLIPISASFHHLTTAELSALSSLSSAAKSSAYCPYSKFRVGCAVLTSDGRFISGANVENASYNVGTCAERVALGRAVTSVLEAGGEKAREFEGGVRRGMFKALAVCTDTSPPASPCGMCRQFIREFCDLNMPIYMFDRDGNFIVMKLEQLLPMSFGPDSLPSPEQLESSMKQHQASNPSIGQEKTEEQKPEQYQSSHKAQQHEAHTGFPHGIVGP